MPRTKKTIIALVIPAYNEAENILHVLRDVRQFQKNYPHWQVLPIVVNDGSTDHTEEVLLQNHAEHPEVKIISLPCRLGIGVAVKSGFRYALNLGANAVLQIDGDGQHPPSEIPKLVCPLLEGQADVVVGSRYVQGAGGIVSTIYRRAGTWFFSKLLRLLVGVKIEDCTSGFRAFTRESADFLYQNYGDEYPEVSAYVPLVKGGFRVLEVPVKMKIRIRGRSSITPLRTLYYVFYVSLETILDRVRPVLHKTLKKKHNLTRVDRLKGAHR